MAELKPCPFCGGAAELNFRIPLFGIGGANIVCTRCKAMVRDTRYFENGIDAEAGYYQRTTIETISGCIERVIEAWNRRADNVEIL